MHSNTVDKIIKAFAESGIKLTSSIQKELADSCDEYNEDKINKIYLYYKEEADSKLPPVGIIG